MEERRPSIPLVCHVTHPSPTPSPKSEAKRKTPESKTNKGPGTPKKHVKLPDVDPCSSKEANYFIDHDSESPLNSPNRRRNAVEVKCNPLCPGHRKHSTCGGENPRIPRDGDSPRPHRHDCDGSHQSRSKHRDHRKHCPSPKINFKELHDLVDAATDGGLGTRQYHSASHLAVLRNKDNDEPSPGMKQRDFSMSHISDRPLTEKELRLMPLKPRSNSNSRSASPLRTIRHSVRIERWENVTDGELNIENMMKKFDLTGFSHNLVELKAGEVMISEISPEVRKAGLVKGKVWVKMYGRRINLILGDILEIPANQAHKAAAEEAEDATMVMGLKEGCCIT